MSKCGAVEGGDSRSIPEVELEFKTFEYPGKDSTRGLNGACEDRGLNAEEAEEYSPGSESPGYESAAGLGRAYGYEAAAAAR